MKILALAFYLSLSSLALADDAGMSSLGECAHVTLNSIFRASNRTYDLRQPTELASLKMHVAAICFEGRGITEINGVDEQRANGVIEDAIQKSYREIFGRPAF